MEISADRPSLWKVIAGATLLVGTLDISDAFKIGPRQKLPLVPLINSVTALVFCIGIPLALIARRFVVQQTS